MKFSIIIPVYNVEKYLIECLDSIILQTYNDFEVIVIDDGSEDSSGVICDEYMMKDNRIKVFHQKNSGVFSARLNSFKYITGDYILFLDSDDYWDKDLLQSVRDTILKHDCDLVIFRYRKVTENGHSIKNLKSFFEEEAIFERENKEILFKTMIMNSELNNLSFKAVKREIIDKIMDFEKLLYVSNGEDLLLSLPMVYNSTKIVSIQKVMYNYRMAPNSITGTFNLYKYLSINDISCNIVEYLSKMNMCDDINLRDHYTLYVKTYMRYIFELNKSNIIKNEKLGIFEEIKKTNLFINSQKYLDLSEFSIEHRIRYFLFINNYYELLFIYEKLIVPVKYIESLIKKVIYKACDLRALYIKKNVRT